MESILFRTTRPLILALCCATLLACKAELGTPDQEGNNGNTSGNNGSSQTTPTPPDPVTPPSDNNTGNNGSGTGSGSSSGSGNTGTVTPPTPPDQPDKAPDPATKPTSLDLAGALSITHEQGAQFDIQLCADKVCVTQSALADGSFGFKLKLSQWPQDKPLRLTASNRQQSAPILSSQLPSLEQLLKQDQNGDGIITEQEAPHLHLSPMLLAYQSLTTALQKREGRQDVTALLVSDPQLNHRMARELKDFTNLVLPGKGHLSAMMAGFIPDEYVEGYAAFVARNNPSGAGT